MSIFYESAVEIASATRREVYKPVETTKDFLDRIEERNQRTNSYINVFDKDSIEQAEEVEQRLEEGEELPLAGVPTAIKDLGYSKKGAPQTMGLKPLEKNIAGETDVITERLIDAGAVILGTTNTPELGHTVRTDNELIGPTSTPFDLEKNSGGSSGGSAAALADGLCTLATGSDVGGSLRNPASCCGVVSVKPSHGLIPRGNEINGFRGHTPVGVLGPMARDTESLSLLLDVMAGKHSSDPFSVPKLENYMESTGRDIDIEGISIAYSPGFDIFPIDQDVRESMNSTISNIEDLGVNVDKVSMDTPSKPNLSTSYTVAATTFFATEVEQVHQEHRIQLLKDHSDELPGQLKTLVSMGRSNDIMDYVTSDFPRTDLFHAIEEVVSSYDALICPTLATPPLTHDEPMPSEIDGEHTAGLPTDWMLSWIFNMTGHPVVNIPSEPVDGLPIGLQLVGETYNEGRLLEIASVFEEANKWSYPAE